MKRILIVTPDPETAETLRLAFELKGFEVIHALSPAVAFDHFKAHDPHIIIVDVMGISMGEFEVTENFVGQIASDARPTFVLTFKIPPPGECPTLHANHLLIKPYNLTTLVKMVTKIGERDA